MSDEQQSPAVPWVPAAGQEPASRKRVAWGSGAGFDAATPPARRAAAEQPAQIGEAFAPVDIDPGATDTARLHAGAFSPDQGTPGVIPAADLSTMFDDDPAQTPAAPAGFFATRPQDEPAAALPAAGTGLPELYQPAEQAPAAPGDPDLSSMFDDEPAPAAAGSAVSPWGGPPADAAAPVPAEQAPAAAPAVAEPASRGRGHFSLAEQRAATAAARSTTSEDFAAANATQNSRRYTEAVQFAPIVERILGLGAQGGSPQLQALIHRLVLTRDKNLDFAQRRDYESALAPLMASNNVQIANPRDRQTIFDMAYDDLIGIGPLGPLWRDDEITEIMVSGPDKVTVERGGTLELTDVRFRDLQHLEETARNLAGLSGDDRAVSSTSPVPTIHLDGARVQFVWKPLAVNGVAIAIRKFGQLHDMGELLSFGSLTEDMAALLSDLVRARATILVSGGTGSGKTTFINAVSEFIPASERVVTIEDARELRLRNAHVEPLVTKEASSADDTLTFDQAVLMKTSLRLRPDRIIVGEVREGKGCAVMLEAANTGHDGTMTTIHANSAPAALTRMTNLLRRVDAMPVDVARAEVASAIDVVVQVVRQRGRRFVSEISIVDTEAGVERGIAATQIYTGEYGPRDAAPVFRRVGGIGPDTELANKMLDAGIDPATWE